MEDNQIEANIDKVYQNLYNTYLLDLRINNIEKKIYDKINEIKYLHNVATYNSDKINIIYDEFDINNVEYTFIEKEEIKKIRTTKYLVFLTIKKKIKEFIGIKIKLNKKLIGEENKNAYLQLGIPVIFFISLFVGAIK
jgi:hypothetical protein